MILSDGILTDAITGGGGTGGGGTPSNVIEIFKAQPVLAESEFYDYKFKFCNCPDGMMPEKSPALAFYTANDKKIYTYMRGKYTDRYFMGGLYHNDLLIYVLIQNHSLYPEFYINYEIPDNSEPNMAPTRSYYQKNSNWRNYEPSVLVAQGSSVVVSFNYTYTQEWTSYNKDGSIDDHSDPKDFGGGQTMTFPSNVVKGSTFTDLNGDDLVYELYEYYKTIINR